MKKRNIIINRKYQLTFAMKFAGISALTMAIIIIICSNILINNNSRLKNININQQQFSEIKSEILNSTNDGEIKTIINRNKGIITILIVSSIIQVLLFFYLMLRRSHRISGPIYLMNRYFDEIIEGNYPDIRPLRENDDFQELFDKFRKVADIMRENNNNMEKKGRKKKK
ncbi:MAG: hypothetical protein FWH53_10895 [Leptospirales bacterium]|nr:hypothetical protein [Leptospirales bacterium]